MYLFRWNYSNFAKNSRKVGFNVVIFQKNFFQFVITTFRIQNALSTAIEKIASKALSKMAKFCENDEEPEICECRNAILGEIRFPLENNLDIAKCKPSRCKCPGSEDWIHVHPGKTIFNRLINR